MLRKALPGIAQIVDPDGEEIHEILRVVPVVSRLDEHAQCLPLLHQVIDELGMAVPGLLQRPDGKHGAIGRYCQGFVRIEEIEQLSLGVLSMQAVHLVDKIAIAFGPVQAH